MKSSESQHESKRRLLDAALGVIRAKGFAATRVDDVCEAAGLSKGAFFHHFSSKEELALQAAAHFGATAEALFAAAPYRAERDPVDRLLAYVDFRASILEGELPEFTCLLGTMVQEAYETHPAIRAACEREIRAHASTLERDIAEARAKYAPEATWSAEGLALHMQAIVQGAFVLAKATGGPEVAVESLGHLRRYLQSLFRRSAEKGPQSS